MPHKHKKMIFKMETRDGVLCLVNLRMFSYLYQEFHSISLYFGIAKGDRKSMKLGRKMLRGAIPTCQLN